MGREKDDHWQGKVAFVAFAKNPELVPVKTRLAQTLGQDWASRLYVALLEDCLASLASVNGVEHYLACYPDVTGQLFQKLALEHGFSLVQQQGEDLGERMLNCIKDLLACHSAVIVFGTDMPVLPLRALDYSLGWMEYWDVLLGPSYDGGYYVFGAKMVHDLMFEEIQWGSHSVFVETIKNCVKLGLEVAFLDVCEDVDDDQSLGRLCKSLMSNGKEAPATRAVLENFGLLAQKD